MALMSALKWLKANNPLFKHMQIDCSSISLEQKDMGPNENDDTLLQAN